MPTPERLGKYLIRRRLGAGAMGVVYEGFDPLIERSVAIKVIRQETFDSDQATELRTRLKREAQAAGRLAHPGIVSVFEYGEGEAGVEAFIAMEMVHGRELKAALDAGERFSTDATARILRGVLGALQHAHERGVVHRDIKPGNVFLLPDGGVKVADFGVARIEASDLTQTGAVIGTPSYMAPEQLLGQAVDGRADLFACGVLLYQLLTGERPFTGSIATVMQKVLNEDPAPPSAHRGELAPHWDAVVQRALAKQPADRFQSADEFAAAVARAASQRSLPAPGQPEDEKTVILPRRAPPPPAPAPIVHEEVPRTVPMPRQPGTATRGTAVPMPPLPMPPVPAPPPVVPVPPPPVPKLPPPPPPPPPSPPPPALAPWPPVPPLVPVPPPARPPTAPAVPAAPPAEAPKRKTALAAAGALLVAVAGAAWWWLGTGTSDKGVAPVEPAASAQPVPVAVAPTPGAAPAPAVPEPSPSVVPQPAAAPSPSPVQVAKPTPSPAPAPAPSPTHSPTPSPTPSPMARPSSSPSPVATPEARPSPPPAPADPWVAARERVERAPAGTGLAGALRLLLDVQDARGRQTLADFERFANALPEHGALVLGVHDGKLQLRWQFRAGSASVAADNALLRCRESTKRPCALVVNDGDFRLGGVQEVARQLGAADIATVRQALLQTLAGGLPAWRESLAAAPAPAAPAPAPYAPSPTPAPAPQAQPPRAPAASPAPAPAAGDWAAAESKLRSPEAPRAFGAALAVLLGASAEDEVETLDRFDSAVRRLRYSSAVALGERGGGIVFGYALGESKGTWAEDRALAACNGLGAQGCAVVWVNGSTRTGELAALGSRLEAHPQGAVRRRFVELLRNRLQRGL